MALEEFKLGSIHFSPSNVWLRGEIDALRQEVEMLRVELHAWKRYTDTLASIIHQQRPSAPAKGIK